MKRLIPIMAMCVAVAGCSSEAPETPVAKTAPAPAPTAAPAVAVATPAHAPPEPAEAPKDIQVAKAEPAAEEPKVEPAVDSETHDIEKLFEKPKPKPVVVEKPAPPPQAAPELPELPIQQDGPPPEMRLIGFSQMHELKALVSISGKLNILAMGETSVEGVELVGLQPPAVKLKWGTTEKEIVLNEQPWTHVSNPTAGSNGVMPHITMPNKPMPVALPGVKKFPDAPTPLRIPSNPTSSSTVGPNVGPPEHRFPAASPPAIPPLPK